MKAHAYDTLMAELDRAANWFKQTISVGLIIGSIIAALALGCCDDRRPSTPDEEPRAQWFQG